jgi:hypothetical protein
MSSTTTTAKFTVGSKVRLVIDGRPRLGYVSNVLMGAKRGARRLYEVRAQAGGRTLGTFRSNDLYSR